MLQIKNIYKEYRTGKLVQKALDDVSLNLRDNEFVAILGPSGSGKTTLLNIIGGLDCYDKGNLIINNISTKDYKDKDWDSYRNHTIGFVFQSYNLIPHQTILANVELALTISGISGKERKKRAMKALREVGLDKHAHKKPNQLSGGQMQRVAIARALVNNPDIVLADEPTGALDSDTSVQVMELLKEVAKDRLVVMVTHNPELAENYATRIVRVRDGKICSDTNPYIIEEEERAKHKNMGKTSMSFLTSLMLSFNNLKTKKGRTFLTAFAGSIGIIGIALILSLSNGVNNYIHSIENDTLSEYPLQIQKKGFDFTSMMASSGMNEKDNKKKEKEERPEREIGIVSTLSTMFSSVGTNDLASLKKYLESDECNINDYVKTIEYTYGISPRIYSSDTENLRQLNPNKSFSSLGLGSGNTSNSLMSSMMSTDVFYELPNNTSLFENQYEVKEGHWPEKEDECIVVLTQNGNTNDMILYTLGLRDYAELDKMMEQFSKNEDVEVQKYDKSYSYDLIMNTKFKLVNNFDCYEYDEEYNIWRDKTDNADYMKAVVNNGKDLKIVGIVQPKEDSNISMLMTGIYYSNSLTKYLIKEASKSKIVQDQIASPEVNVFTGKRFDDTSDKSSFDMNSLMEIDGEGMKSAFKFDESKIDVDLSNFNNIMKNVNLPAIDINEIINEIDFKITNDDIQRLMTKLVEGYGEYVNEHPDSDINKMIKQFSDYLNSKEAGELLRKEIEEIIKENKGLTVTEEQLKQIMTKLFNQYNEYVNQNGLIDMNQFGEFLADYLKSDIAKRIVSDFLTELIKSQNLDKQLNSIMQKYMQSIINQVSKNIEKEIKNSMTKLSTSMAKAINIDTNAFISAIKLKMNEEELSELFVTMMSTELYSYDNNLKKLNYAEFDNPDGINIFPKDFNSNESITNLLDDYNEKMKKEKHEEKVISYTDMVGSLMSSVTTIVDVISYVLVAFVAISLVVSSIMIGVITYISVLERKKEIGILRAIGASKRNISQVFNAETFIIGLLAGILGIVITLIALIPINYFIHKVADGVDVTAVLPFMSAIILIVLSTVLTLIGGILPSRKAAKEDPVLALRSE